MRYVAQQGPGGARRVFHIARYTPAGEMLLAAVCGIRLRFDWSINAPWGLGHRICRRCCKSVETLSP